MAREAAGGDEEDGVSDIGATLVTRDREMLAYGETGNASVVACRDCSPDERNEIREPLVPQTVPDTLAHAFDRAAICNRNFAGSICA